MVEENCPECGKQFGSETGVKIHYGKCHDGSISGVKTRCEECGETFRQSSGNQSRRDRDFCSTDCYHNWMEGRTGEKSFKYKSVEVSCNECGNNIERQPNVIEKNQKHFCDNECRGEYLSKSMKAENNHNFNPNYTADYGENWNGIRSKVLERDFHSCRYCGVSQDQHKKKTGIGLDVHHKIPLYKFDSPERANKLYNLISLCRECHTQEESRIINNIDDAESA
jgi:endogenous inhibitor of DNA gyrase (YacG/DUF329 family)